MKKEENKIDKWLTADTLIMASSILFVGIITYYAFTLFCERPKFAVIYIGIGLAVSAILGLEGVSGGKPIFGLKGRANKIVVLLLATAPLVTMYYFSTQYDELFWIRAGAYTRLDYFFSAIVFFMCFLMSFKDQGLAIVSVATVAIIYALLGTRMPGIFMHSGFTVARVVRNMVLEYNGIYGLITQTSASTIGIFFVFSGFIRGFNILDYLIYISGKVVGRSIKNIPQIAVISSMFFGGFCGSASANVAATGSVTIPIMKRIGLVGEKAGACEAVASTGGQIMPPILGAAAFMMAAFLRTTYWNIVGASIVPAIIFYTSVSLGVYLLTRKMEIDPIIARQLEQEGTILKVITSEHPVRISSGIPLLISIIIFVYYMGVIKVSAVTGGSVLLGYYLIFQIIYLFITDGVKVETLKYISRCFFNGIKIGATSMAQLCTTVALLGILTRVLIGTGLSQRLAFGMVDLARGNIFYLLILILLLTLAFGMTVATVAAYIVVVLLAAPSLVQMGVQPMVAHFVVFYFAILACITPPVALPAAIAANLAEAGFFSTCYESIKLGIALFIFPFVFTVRPTLLVGPWGARLITFVVTLIGMILMVLGLNWYEIKGWRTKLMRLGFFTAGMSVIFWPLIKSWF